MEKIEKSGLERRGGQGMEKIEKVDWNDFEKTVEKAAKADFGEFCFIFVHQKFVSEDTRVDRIHQGRQGRQDFGNNGRQDTPG